MFDEAWFAYAHFHPLYRGLDVATRMMAGSEGQDLLDGVLEQAIAFRRELAAVRPAADGWWFRAWQPPAAASGTSSQERAQVAAA